jgi:exodeoxyribonuclease V beta subunit
VLIAEVQRKQQAQLAQLKAGWYERATRMEQWIAQQRAVDPKCFNGNKMRPDSLAAWFNGLRDWAQIRPASCRTFRTPRGTA